MGWLRAPWRSDPLAWAVYTGLFALMTALKSAAITANPERSGWSALIWLVLFVWTASECAKAVHEWRSPTLRKGPS
jgi:hypothetical protein